MNDAPFVSYAQNCEDVILWRALGSVPAGFYVDVGAYDPYVDSVTAGFYERGWSGLNIEANPRLLPRLRIERPRDINVCFAASSRTGTTCLFEVENMPGGYGLSTGRPEIAEMHRSAGLEVQPVEVCSVRLSDLLDVYAPPEIHFLKIDVEGMEREVLLGAGLHNHRPWIILSEATQPNSQAASHEQYEDVLINASYRFAYFDGLNRFYLAEERWADLSQKIALQPNIFDGYVRWPGPATPPSTV